MSSGAGRRAGAGGGWRDLRGAALSGCSHGDGLGRIYDGNAAIVTEDEEIGVAGDDEIGPSCDSEREHGIVVGPCDKVNMCPSGANVQPDTPAIFHAINLGQSPTAAARRPAWRGRLPLPPGPRRRWCRPDGRQRAADVSTCAKKPPRLPRRSRLLGAFGYQALERTRAHTCA
jgi:hypothetical protein